MRDIQTPLVQQILNKCNSRVNFTRDLTPSSGVKGRYIVSAVDIFTGKNPSMQSDLILKLAEEIEAECPFVDDGHYYNSIGGWLNQDTGMYHIGANLHYFNLENAMRAARTTDQIAIYDRFIDDIILVE